MKKDNKNKDIKNTNNNNNNNNKLKEPIINIKNVIFFVDFFKENLVNGYIQKIQKIDTKDIYIKFKINTKEKKYIFIVGNGVMILSNYNPEVYKINRGFSNTLNQKLHNRRILDVYQKDAEKIIIFEFFDYFLIFELFSHNNIILVDKNYKIIDCLFKEDWKTRSIRPNKQYVFPETKFKKINYVDINDFNLKNNLVSEILNKINISPTIVELILKDLNINKENYDKEDIKKVFDKIKTILEDKNYVNFCYFIEKNKKIELYNIDFKKYFSNIYENNLKNNIINENLFGYFDKYFIKEKMTEIKNKEINKEKNKYLKIVESQEKKLKQFEKEIIENKIKGDLIYQYYNELSEILNVIKKHWKDQDLEKKLEANKSKNNLLKLIKKIDRKNKKIIFTLHQQ